MGVLVQMINTVSIEKGCSALYAMYFIPLLNKHFCQVGTVLAGYTGNECFFGYMINFLYRFVI
jgi:hypothetical protein